MLQGGAGRDAALRSRLHTVLALFQEHNEFNSSMARSQTNTARIDGLRPGMVYVVQVRARTVAGYGKFSGKMCFQTLTDGKRRASELVLGQHLGEGKKPREATLAAQMPTFPGFQCHSLTSGGAVCTCVIHKAGHPSEVWPVSLLTSHGFAFEGSLHHMQGGHCSETHTYLCYL